MPDDSPIQSRVPIQKSVPTWADEKEPSADALVAPKFANFTKYVPGEGRTKCQALFVPSGVSIPNNKMVDLVGKTWRLPMPNLLIACDAGMAHPSGLATDELIALPQFEALRRQSSLHVSKDQQRREISSGRATPTPTPELLLRNSSTPEIPRFPVVNDEGAGAIDSNAVTRPNIVGDGDPLEEGEEDGGTSAVETYRRMVASRAPAAANTLTQDPPSVPPSPPAVQINAPSGAPVASPPPSPARTGGGLFDKRSRIHPAPEEPYATPIDSRARKVIQRLIFQKLRTIFAAVVEAAAMSNNWIIVDRTKSKSPTAEYLLELALAQVQQKPTVIVIDSEDRLARYKQKSQKAQKQLEKLAALKAKSAPLGSDLPPTSMTLEWLYSPPDFMDPNAYDHLPLPRDPEDAHVDSATGKVYPEMIWWYHYLQTLYSSGTHYILLEKGEDDFDLSTCCGPLGFVCAAGGVFMRDRLVRRFELGQPVVMLHNSGGITQSYASLLRAIVREPNAPADRLLDKVEVPVTKSWASEIGMPEILMMKELMARAPALFQTTIVTVDLLEDNAESVLQTLTAAFEGVAGD